MRNPSKYVCTCVRFICLCQYNGAKVQDGLNATNKLHRSVVEQHENSTQLRLDLCYVCVSVFCVSVYANVQLCKDGLNATDKIVFVEQPENSQQQPAARKPRIAG